ncbi:MAG TPA: thermonuclease family protein [Noviherbaspirillum sp.]
MSTHAACARHGETACHAGSVLKRLLVLLVFLGAFTPAYAYKVIGIADGDTLTLLVRGKPLKIRLANIDAPESRQAFGTRSKQHLSTLCYGKEATYRAQDIDRYGRTVAVVYCDGVEANRMQVEYGMAWVNDRYNRDPSLLRLQQEAREMRRGLWSDPRPVPPWRWRKQSKAERQR